jgi:hypothetical protein
VANAFVRIINPKRHHTAGAALRRFQAITNHLRANDCGCTVAAGSTAAFLGRTQDMMNPIANMGSANEPNTSSNE